MNTVQIAKRFERNDWGGAETVVLETSKRLKGMGHDTEVYCTLNPGGLPEEQIEGVNVRRFPYFYPFLGLSAADRDALHRKGGSPFSFQLMRALQTRQHMDIIHLHAMGRFGGIGRYVARKRRIPYLVSLHGGVFDVPSEETESWRQAQSKGLDWGKPLGMWVGARRVLEDAHAILCVGYPESRLAQERMPSKRVVYLPNGVDPDRFASGDGIAFRRRHGVPEHARVLLTIARIDSQKNQLMLVESLPQLRAADPNVHLVLVGPVTNAQYLATIKETIRRQQLEHAVTIAPGLPAGSLELVDAYHSADIFVLPSIHEPFGIAILEAWAAGLPVMAGNVGGVPHFVADGEDAVLFNPRNPAEFIAAFSSLVGSPDKMRALGERGSLKARTKYSWDAITGQLVKLYATLIDEHSLRA